MSLQFLLSSDCTYARFANFLRCNTRMINSFKNFIIYIFYLFLCQLLNLKVMQSCSYAGICMKYLL